MNISIMLMELIIPCVIINAFQVDYSMDTVKGLNESETDFC